MRNRYYALEVEGTKAEVMIYGDVTSWPWMESDVSSYNLARQIKDLDVDEIHVGINSYGGEVAEGLAIYNSLKNHPAKIVTRCDGFACSVASVIFAAGDERIMNDASLLMIHNAWTFASGDANALRKQADDLDQITEASIKAYSQIVNIGDDEIRQMMDDETWIGPEKALEIGLATSIANSDTDKPAQNARKKAFMRIVNPYMASEADERRDERPRCIEDEDQNGADSGTGDGENAADNENPTTNDGENAENGGENGENGQDSAENEDENAENGENLDQNPGDDEDDAQMSALFRAIMAL